MAIAVSGTAIGEDLSGTLLTSLATSTTATTTGWIAIVYVMTSVSISVHTAPTDTAGNTYSSVQAEVSDVAYGKMSMWKSVNITGNGANVVTGHFGSSAFDAIAVVYVSAGATSSETDVTFATASGQFDPATSDAFTTTNANDMIIAGVTTADSGHVYSADTIGGVSATLLTTGSSSQGQMGIWYKGFTATQSSITAVVSQSALVNAKILGIALKELSGGETVTVDKWFRQASDPRLKKIGVIASGTMGIKA